MKVLGSGGAQRRQNPPLIVIFERLDDNGLAQAVAFLDGLLQVTEDSSRGYHGGPHDAHLTGIPQQSRHAGLRDVEPGGDFRLAEALLVIHPRYLGNQPDLVGVRKRVARPNVC